MALEGRTRLGWLLLAALSIGTTGVWVMHFIAMLGYTIPGAVIHYNVLPTIASMLIAVVVVGIGLLIVGFARQTWRNLILAGAFTGVGVAAMHYTGMEAMHMYPAASASGMLMAGGGATAATFLMPLVVGISVVAFILTATLALSPDDEEIRAEQELMERIGLAGGGAAAPDRVPALPDGPARAVSRTVQARRQAGSGRAS
jgi:NO-binding membrane sensor protein with MHYT domain